jgi:hypothetical protein
VLRGYTTLEDAATDHLTLVLYHWEPLRRTQSQRTRVALLLPAIFVAPLFLWYFVLNNVAVNRSISLTPGTTVTQDSWVNYSGFYRLGIVRLGIVRLDIVSPRRDNGAPELCLMVLGAPAPHTRSKISA